MTVRNESTAFTVPSMQDIAFFGGRLCLDFVNTANWVDHVAVDERLTGMEALSVWAFRQGLSQEVALAGDLEDFLALRRALRRFLATPRLCDDEDLACLNRGRAQSRAPMVWRDGRGALLSMPGSGWLLRTIADSAVELLLTSARTRVKLCPGPRCGWLFLDESPNGRRRWCSMTTCGNRAKARRHYRQQRQA